MQCDEMLDALGAEMPEDERLILCGFEGDPNEAGPRAWRPRPWRPGRSIPFEPTRDNAYVTISSFRRAGDGSFRRRGECFAAGRALMVDDVGTKVDRASVESVPPSAIVETSAGNEQWWYFLAEPEADGPRFDGIIRAFIASRLLGADPGMSGVTRVGRLPGFVNGKKKARDFATRLLSLSDRRFTTGELLERFSLTILGRVERREKLPTSEAIERNRAFAAAYRYLATRGMLKRGEPDLSGWTEMRCPWLDDHTGRADTGAAIREPAEENGYYGAFRCHHGHCADRGWGELSEWVAEAAAEELEERAA